MEPTGKECPEPLVSQLTNEHAHTKEKAMYLYNKIKIYLDCTEADNNMGIVLDCIVVMVILEVILISVL